MTSNQETLAGVAQCTSTGHGDAEAPQTLHSMGRWRDCSGIGAFASNNLPERHCRDRRVVPDVL
jgi:hypothetical protein